MSQFRLWCVVLLVSVFSVSAAAGTVTGDLKVWHKVTVSFDGPDTGEQAVPNPFTDYRLDVMFRGPSGQHIFVPGYYAADGHAAETSADAGNQWRVHFLPEQAGQWTYRASFRTGKDVALSDDPTAGEPVDDVDGQEGTFTVEPTDKKLPDFRARGLLCYRGERYLQFAGTDIGKPFQNNDYFLKCGVDAPENLLAYADFDGAFKSDGVSDELIKTWAPHVRDWRDGDPQWQNGKGKGLIGALNYLAAEGLNAVSFLTMNIEGDDKNVFPYTDTNERFRLDVSRLAQWEIVFEHADTLGLFLHFKTQETENDQLLDGGALGPQRRLYYRELIARFAHHPALNWNLGEENTNTTEQVKQFSAYFDRHDPYHHPVVLHTYPDQKEKVYGPLLGAEPGLDGVSLQTNFADFRAVHRDVLEWVLRSAAAGKPWVVSCDEPGDAQHALVPDTDDPTHDNARTNALWGAVTAGGAGLEWYFGYDHAQSDLTCQDFRSRDDFWDQCRFMLEFFKNNQIPFWEMSSDDDLLTGTDGYCLQKPSMVYVVFLKTATGAKLKLPEGGYSVGWYNPRTGGGLQTGSVTTLTGGEGVSLGTPPNTPDKDWEVLVKKLTFAGRWQGSGVDSEGNAFTFGAEVVALGEERYRMLVLDRLGSQNEPLHVMDGVLTHGRFDYTADKGLYTGSGTLAGDVFEGYYKGPVDGDFTMQRVR